MIELRQGHVLIVQNDGLEEKELIEAEEGYHDQIIDQNALPSES